MLLTIGPRMYKEHLACDWGLLVVNENIYVSIGSNFHVLFHYFFCMCLYVYTCLCAGVCVCVCLSLYRYKGQQTNSAISPQAPYTLVFWARLSCLPGTFQEVEVGFSIQKPVSGLPSDRPFYCVSILSRELLAKQQPAGLSSWQPCCLELRGLHGHSEEAQLLGALSERLLFKWQHWEVEL